MISVEIFGRVKHAERVEFVCLDILQYFMPRTAKTIEVEVHFINTCDDNASGDCYGDANGAYINIARASYNYAYSFNEQLLTLCHELVHAKQFIKGELSENGQVWKGVDMSLIRDLKNQPWEREAFDIETKLYNKYITIF